MVILSIILELSLFSIGGFLFWYIPRVARILYPKKRKVAFSNVSDLTNILSTVKGPKFFYLTLSGTMIILVLIVDGAVLGINFALEKSYLDLYEGATLMKFWIPHLIIFPFFQCLFCFIFWKLSKKVNVSFDDKKVIIHNFLSFKENWIKNKPLKKVTIKTFETFPQIIGDLDLVREVENPNVTELSRIEKGILFGNIDLGVYASKMVSDRAINFTEKIYRWKVKRLLKKELTPEKYSWKLSKIFIAYLNICANFVLIVRMNQELPFVAIDGKPVLSVLDLKAALINNFFCYEQEFSKNQFN